MRILWMVTSVCIMAAVVGCEPSDERLVRFAEQAVQSQQRQNELIARQSEKVVQESHELAEAAKLVVAADAQARGEMIKAHHELNEGLHLERVGVDRQREKLEEERSVIATQRNRDPIIAAALHATGILFACTLPLFLAGYALWQMNQKVDDNAELGFLLIDEFTSSQPMLLPPQMQLLSQSRSSDPGGMEPPF